MGNRQWHACRFEASPQKIRVACLECSREMFLPPSKVGEYLRCGQACNVAWKARRRAERTRACETCGAMFTPRWRQLQQGGGRFCGQACNTAARAALLEPEVKLRAIAAKGGRPFISELTGTDRRNARSRAYRGANPDKVKEWAVRRGNINGRERLPRGTVSRIGDAQRWRCAICRRSIRKRFQADHVEPVTRGGRHEGRNIQLLCPTCNMRKGAKDPIDYMRSLGKLL